MLVGLEVDARVAGAETYTVTQGPRARRYHFPNLVAFDRLEMVDFFDNRVDLIYTFRPIFHKIGEVGRHQAVNRLLDLRNNRDAGSSVDFFKQSPNDDVAVVFGLIYFVFLAAGDQIKEFFLKTLFNVSHRMGHVSRQSFLALFLSF